MAKLKGIKDQSESSEKTISSNKGSWIADLEAKNKTTVASEAKAESKEVKPVQVATLKTKRPAHARPSHHRGHGKISNTVCITLDGGKTAIKMFRKQADQLVQDNRAKYVSKTVWRELNGSTSMEKPEVSEFAPKAKTPKTKTKKVVKA